MSLAAAAELIGHKGQNPARTWHRWEVGERKCPADIIARVEAASAGKVTAASWAFVRQSFVDQRERKSLAAVAALGEAQP
ncbi:hypothetical protein [Xanthobacter autotrophicus]|uniref:hypothetical protein n=1 Tax=Xanthobacter autotrophicus TaxID=280 RepID=UPI003728B317